MGSKNVEIKYLTGLRGICALWVMLGHIFYSPSEVQNSHGIRFMIELLLSISYLGVDIFFVLSAYVLSINYEQLFKNGINPSNYKVYLLKRIARILPLYLFVILIAVTIQWKHITFREIIPYFTFSQIFNNTGINGLWVTWSLNVEMIMYIILPFLYCVKNRTVFFLVLAFIGYIGVIFSEPNPAYYFHFLNKTNGTIALLRGMSGFLLGIWLYRKIKSIKHRSNTPKILLLFKNILSSDFFYKIGTISYSIYLIHPLVLSFFPTFFNIKRSGMTEASIYFFSTILISIITFFLIEIPGKKTILRLGSKK